MNKESAQLKFRKRTTLRPPRANWGVKRSGNGFVLGGGTWETERRYRQVWADFVSGEIFVPLRLCVFRTRPCCQAVGGLGERART